MSEGFVLNFYNNTDVDATLTATVGSWGEWESKTQHNPEVDIQALPARRHRLTPGEAAAPIHLETSSGAAAATFTVSADLGGKQLVFELDGCDATKMRERAGIPVSVGGQDFTVLQVMTVMDEIDNGDSRWNKMSVFITPCVDTKKWMAQYPDRTLMSVNIPGTHDTGTYGGTGEMCSKCQQLDIAQQLEAGIRFLDLRLVFHPKERSDDLQVSHGGLAQGVWLRQHIIPAVNDFLAANPTECVIFCVNRDSNLLGPLGDPLDTVLHNILVQDLPHNTLFDHNTDAILTATLNQLKGCVVLLRQDLPQTFGLNVSNWPDDDANSSTGFAPRANGTMAGTIRMQNAYEYGIASSYGIGEKWKNVKAHLARAAYFPSPQADWWLNWTNASHTPPTTNWCPWGFAYGGGSRNQYAMRGVNFLLAQHLVLNTAPGKCRFGTVIMDYPEEPQGNTLIQLLLAWNRSISPTVPSKPATVTLPGGNQQIFKISPAGHLMTDRQSSAGSPWSGWTDLGGPYTGSPAAVVNAQGVINVFMTDTNGNLQATWQPTPGGNWGRLSLGGATVASSPSIVFQSQNVIAAFAISSTGTLMTTWQSPTGQWQPWQDQGGSFVGSPAAVVNAQNEISVFMTGTDGNLYAGVQSTPSGPLGAPVTLGGTILAGSPSIGMFSDGRMDAFVNDAQGNTHTSSQQARGSGWTAWAQI